MILCYLKEFCIQLHLLVHYVSVDDKVIIPVGEPGLPVSSGVRRHNHSVVLAEGPSPGAWTMIFMPVVWYHQFPL